MSQKKIAVVGSGVSGLLAALHARKEGHEVTVFEQADRWGGNVYTRKVWVPAAEGKPVERWCDMGVNDFNAKRYVNMVKLFDFLGVPYAKLINSCSFRDTTGKIEYYIKDDGTTVGMPEDLEGAFREFKETAPRDAENPQYEQLSIKEYLEARFRSVPGLGRYVIYPRVNGMYFNADIGPEQMPFVSVMAYYKLQEGFPDEDADRKYFVHGASDFIDRLIQFLSQRGRGEWPGDAVKFESVYPGQCRIDASGAGVDVYRCDRPPYRSEKHLGHFDDVILAVPSYDAVRAIRSGITQDMMSVLGEIDYYSSVAYVHTFEEIMPPESMRCAYNIHIHDGYQALLPYTISYVVNLHQNDPAKKPPPGGKQFFCTLNPRIPIPDEHVLRDSPDAGGGSMVSAFFPHNAGTFRTLRAQARLWDTKSPVQGQNHVFFTGGWTHGAGLMEQCFLSARDVVARLNKTDHPALGIFSPRWS